MVLNKRLQAFEQEISKENREKTVNIYKRYLSSLPEINILEMSELEICGIVNKTLINCNSRIALSAFRKYIKFLYLDALKSNISGEKVELLRRKKNNILANIELPEQLKKSTNITKDDLHNMYIPPDVLLDILKKADFEMKVIILVLYDCSLRINELLGNTISNIKEKGIEINKELSKTHQRDRKSVV